MLKLKRVQILGFKSFCDRTELSLAGEGIAAIVGPNGCGKSNISDAITWVLGEQSAKSLRGIKMEDVIFAGTRDRKSTGMAEVSLTLVDPEVYDNASPVSDDSEPGVVAIDSTHPSDWDEIALRRQRAQETEEAVAEAQPGTILEDEAHPEPEANSVVLRIRRRRFGRAPVRAGELTITRRLFRTGDSEYLLNGKICRLRDIQDIFLGTGLGGESYAIIGQERIGQLLSSKPLDRRSIIEEAAGITRFKTKKRLAELRLESARQNLSRVDDIFEEVTRQLGTLKRQAARAERYGALRDELRTRLRVVVASRLTQLDAEQAATSTQVVTLSKRIELQSAELETLDSTHIAGVQHGYALDSRIGEASAEAGHAAVELERITARVAANQERVAELAERLAHGHDDLREARTQLDRLNEELVAHRLFVESANGECLAARTEADAGHRAFASASQALANAEAQVELQRRAAIQLMERTARSRNEEVQAAAALAALEGEGDRLARESATARDELATLGLQRGQIRLSFDAAATRLKALEAALVMLRDQLQTARADEAQSKRRADQLRGDRATLAGRRNSLEALIREHSYSTDTVRNLFRAAATRRKQDPNASGPLGTLADFLEVDSQYEAIVDEYLRDELNTIVVPTWGAADDGIRTLAKEVAGRATFLVANEVDAPPRDSQTKEEPPPLRTVDVVALTEAIRIAAPEACLEFAGRVRSLLPKLGRGYIAPDSEAARSLAAEYPDCFFLAPTGESFHGHTVTGGRPSAQGPLALKRELHDVQEKVAAMEAQLAEADQASANLARQIAQHQAESDARTHERRDLERESANSGAALRQVEAEAQRLERRLADWQLALARNGDARRQKADLIALRQEEAAALEAERHAAELSGADLQGQLDSLRHRREELQHSAAATSATLAGLEERRRNAAANLDQTTRLHTTQAQRLAQLDAQLAASGAEKLRREAETATLTTRHLELTATRAEALATTTRLSAEATALREQITALDAQLRAIRLDTEALRESRAESNARAARLASALEHLEATCLNDLARPAAELREDPSIARIEGQLLAAEEAETRSLKQKLDALGPVNMMALEEFTETAARHTFLEAQRKDLLDAIADTQASIQEIDGVSRVKFDEAFEVINRNFAITFAKLFGGGQASMRLTDTGNAAESGIDILASPPGKKLQNILLLSGGEKALTALSLLVGIFQFQPAPFCVLDEVDAPLDETNTGRFSKLIAEMSATTQFVVITHSKRTMQQADVIYGVTMQEPGVSKIVSVNLSRPASTTGRRAVA